MIKTTKHHDAANFLIHEDKVKEWMSQFSKRTGYQFVGYQFVENWSGYQFVGYQFVGYQFVGCQFVGYQFVVINNPPTHEFKVRKTLRGVNFFAKLTL